MSRNWGIAGFGEVGATFARQLLRTSHVAVTDPRLTANRSSSSDPGRRAVDLGVEVAPDAATLAMRCDVLISTVTPSAARHVAEAAAGSAVTFIDFNSISPGEKQVLAALFDGDRYIDGAILGSISAEGARAPLALSGTRAEDVQRSLAAAGFQASVVGTAVGAASALKMCRSVFMKGVECLFVETVLAADRFGIVDPVLQSAEQTFASLGFQGTARMLLTTHAAHSGRRADEMAKVTAMLADLCLPHAMSAASHETLATSAESGLTEHVEGRVPPDPETTTDYLATFYRRRCQ